MVKISALQIPTTTQKFPSQQDFPSPQWADIPGFHTGVENMGVGDWGENMGERLQNAAEKHL